jgi:flavin-dependent thymidylate synthase
VDADLLGEIVCHHDVEEAALTPETLSAAYARISRDPAPVGELREKAREDVTKARKSNQSIVFGYGHASVAEHAVLNFDITGLSRLAIEALEHSRLCSYTEKSQRYQKLSDDYVMPAELSPHEQEFRALVARQNEAYREAYETISRHLKQARPDLDAGARKGKAKEDARYLTSLAMEGQLGMTLNARSLELMIRRLASHPLMEARELAQALQQEGVKIVPSLLHYVGGDPMRCLVPRFVAEAIKPFIGKKPFPFHDDDETYPEWRNVFPIRRDGSLEDVVTALMQENCMDSSSQCFDALRENHESIVRAVMREVFEWMEAHSAAPRAFELAGFSFEVVMSASCFAQMKRHRMATILPQPYDPSIPPRMPESFEDAGLAGLFREVTGMSSELFEKISRSYPAAAPYALTQAHRRRVVVRMNARDMYHFSRLRMDGHAQWEIRKLAGEMVRQARQDSPMLMALACGKDEFDVRKRKVMEVLDASHPIALIGQIG